MADIRINALATTATSAASDDYLALDGSANGTRKILATNVAQNVTDVTFGSSGPSAKSSINARAARQGLVFDGTAGATVSVPAFGTGDFTVAAWVNPTLSAGSNLISGNAAINVPQIAVTTNGTIAVANQGIGTIVSSSAGALVANKTKLVVWRRASGTSYLYIDGIEIGSAADTSNFSTGVGNIGSRGFYGGEIFIGTLSVLIYNRALSASEVVSLFEAGVPAAADYNTASSSSIVSGAWVKNAGTGTFTSTAADNLTVNISDALNAQASTTFSVRPGQKIALRGSFASITGGASVFLYDGSFISTSTALTSTGAEITATAASSSAQIYITSGGAVSFTGTSISVVRLGLLLAPDAGQAGGGLTWYDTSGNAANITLPASGVAWSVPTSGKTASGWTFGGNLTVSGTGTSNVGGTLVVGSTSAASGSGKLELATHTTYAGGIGFGTDTSLYRTGQGSLALDGGTLPILRFFNGATQYGYVYAGSTDGELACVTGPLRLKSNNTTALTLDSSQNATFAGSVNVTGGSNPSSSTMQAMLVTNTSAPRLALIRSTSSANQKIFELLNNGDGTTSARYVNDAYSAVYVVMKWSRNGIVSMPNLPTSSSGLSAGDIWNDGGTLKIA